MMMLRLFATCRSTPSSLEAAFRERMMRSAEAGLCERRCRELKAAERNRQKWSGMGPGRCDGCFLGSIGCQLSDGEGGWLSEEWIGGAMLMD